MKTLFTLCALTLVVLAGAGAVLAQDIGVITGDWLLNQSRWRE